MANTKICSKCGKKKSFSKFYKHEGNNKSGLDSQCKMCKEKYQKHYSKTAKRKKQIMKANLRRMYNMTLHEYDQMFIRQNGLCAICEKPEINRRLSVDHNHETGEVRGLLCVRCNNALSVIENDDFVEAAKKYLHKY